MAEPITKKANRRQQVRQQRARTSRSWRTRLMSALFSWPALLSVLFLLGVVAVAMFGETTLGYSVGQRVDRPIYALVGFHVPDVEQTAANREAARASTPSYYTWNKRALTFDRIRADLMRVYQTAVDAATLDEYAAALKDLGWPAERSAYDRLHAISGDAGRSKFQVWVDELPLEREYVVRDLHREPRDPLSTTDYIAVETPGADGGVSTAKVELRELVPQGNRKALRGSASALAQRFSLRELIPVVEAVVLKTFSEQPTIVFQKERTVEAMRKAEEGTPAAYTSYEKGKAFVHPGVLKAADYELLRAHHAAYLSFLAQEVPEAVAERRVRMLQRIGTITLMAMLSAALLVYIGLHEPRVLSVRARGVSVLSLLLLTLLAVRLLALHAPQIPELMYGPTLFTASVMAIVYARRFSIGVMCIFAVMVAIAVRGDVSFLLALFTGMAVAAFQLEEIRSRTKLISTGVLSALALVLVSLACGVRDGNSIGFVLERTSWAGGCALAAAFVVSGLLPYVERVFRVATSLTLLEWRDPTRPLLQLLAREAPGTYNHCLVVGTLAESACEAIGANGLLAQVGALYHDIGKIHKAEYFTENQEGRFSRHENLAPTMSLLIILGHVKDGIEMAREYKLPRVLHQFIQEHHGTTVVRYFHHMASEQQPRIASGKHDRSVSEAEFRYAGPKPRSRESAVLMMCDGVEGAVRSLPEPTANRIESVVHQVIADRLKDRQFDDCDITLREIRQVEESLVKSLCSIYHGRVAYPKARKPEHADPVAERRVSG